MKLIKAIVFGFITACIGSILMALGIATIPFAVFGFIPLWGMASYYFYGCDDDKSNETHSRRQQKAGVRPKKIENAEKPKTRRKRA